MRIISNIKSKTIQLEVSLYILSLLKKKTVRVFLVRRKQHVETMFVFLSPDRHKLVIEDNVEGRSYKQLTTTQTGEPDRC